MLGLIWEYDSKPMFLLASWVHLRLASSGCEKNLPADLNVLSGWSSLGSVASRLKSAEEEKEASCRERSRTWLTG